MALVAALLLAGCGGGGSGPGADAPTRSSSSDSSSSFQPTPADFREVKAMLARRARAARTGDQQAFMTTVDTSSSRLVDQQRTLFANLAQLPVASLRYAVDASSLLVPGHVSGTDPVIRPPVTESLQLTGTMTHPVTNHVDVTFVRRDGHWLVGDEIAAPEGDTLDAAQERPWLGVPIDVSTSGPMTVLIDRSDATRIEALTQEIRNDIRVDSALLGVPARYGVLVDATSNGASTSFSSLSKEEAAAVTFGLFQQDASGRYVATAGTAIKINPHEVTASSLSTPLLRHELTHYLLGRYLGSSPKWLSEGVANWVEYYPDDYPALRLLGTLYERTIHADRQLPTLGLFNDDPDVNYQIAQAAVAWLVAHYGMPRLLSLMTAYRTDYQGVNVDALTPKLLQQEYGVTEQQVVTGAFGLIASFQH